MAVLTILCDSREQKPWAFDGYPVETEEVTLTTGDYSLAEACYHDERLDTYRPTFAVERKSGSDFLHSITHRRDEFKAEIKRAVGWDEPLKVNIESPWQAFQNRYSEVLRYRDVYPNQIQGTVSEWEKWYNVEFHFFADRQTAEQDAFDTLMTWYRTEQYTR